MAWFKEHFDMNGREALALMGAHTVGEYSTFNTHIDYAWTGRGLAQEMTSSIMSITKHWQLINTLPELRMITAWEQWKILLLNTNGDH